MQMYERAIIVLQQWLGEDYHDTLEKLQDYLQLFDDNNNDLQIAIRNQILLECIKCLPVHKSVTAAGNVSYDSWVVFDGHRLFLSTVVNGFHTVTKITYSDGSSEEIEMAFASLADGHRRALLEVLLDTALSVKESCLRSTVRRKEIDDTL